ncbi:uncharacterized protein DUF5007 [Chitinophaga dinghuensis]|uniref:Uncharacterized protein DUF5007 n=1 Tax=Chitinophaga dinghuensis TaxID=1539050 RepID=A0A327WDY7_9BACT|nr:DUF5007 domain-containing protein [Chitinophaga dinghuensis]RAJ87616.1 uncharacterized protein DUF5007 [Chitinophaga dinghuensis]
MKFKHIILACLPLIAGFTACQKVETGYLSDYPRYADNPLTITQGVFKMSAGIIPDNSTPPLNVTLLDVRDKATGKHVDAFFQEYDTYVWTKPYDPTTDTTFDLINAKRSKTKKKPLEILAASGQLIFSDVTANITPGTYTIDLQISNPRGTKQYKNICDIVITAPKEYEYVNAPYALAAKTTAEEAIRFSYDADWIDQLIGRSTTAWLKIKKVASEPNQIIFVVKDKYGNIFPPQALQKRPSGSTYLKTMETFAVKTFTNDTATIHQFATVPFPHTYWDGQSNGTNCYYRIYNQYIQSIDTANTKNWFPPNTISYGEWNKQPVNLNVRMNTKIYTPGTYVYELTLQCTMKK